MGRGMDPGEISWKQVRLCNECWRCPDVGVIFCGQITGPEPVVDNDRIAFSNVSSRRDRLQVDFGDEDMSLPDFGHCVTCTCSLCGRNGLNTC